MASLSSMNSKMVSEMLGREVADAVILVAKNLILGGSVESVSQILGVAAEEVEEILASQDYRDAHLLMAAQYNHDSLNTDLTYDDIETIALSKIVKGLEREKDLDKLTRIASMANKAIRRQKMPTNPDVLDPGSAKGSVRLTLSKRIVERLNSTGQMERERTEQISIHSGISKPSFEEISKFFDPKGKNVDLEKLPVDSSEAITAEAILQSLKDDSR